MRRTFVIGDVHGHLDRLEALLLVEGIIGRCPECDGAGLVPEHCGRSEHEYDCPCEVDCLNCDGDGIARIDHDTFVVQLGDLGHYGAKGSPTGDLLCWRAVYKSRWVDVVLWGNHDRALVDNNHAFKGYVQPSPETTHFIKAMYAAGRLQLAFEAHGHLLTHAGLHKVFKHQKIDPEIKDDLTAFVDWINSEDDKWLDDDQCHPEAAAIRDAIGRKRGGSVDYGGLLWRDSRETLYRGWPQVFGHSKGELIRTYNEQSYCIDIGSPDNGRLAGMWLPSRTFVQIDTTKRDENGDADVMRFPA
jgi:hypothetical protein